MRTFEEYTRSLDFLVMLTEPEDKRIEAAWEAGGRRGVLRDPVRVYLYDLLRAAFGS